VAFVPLYLCVTCFADTEQFFKLFEFKRIKRHLELEQLSDVKNVKELYM
jgi:hypothetical protein